MTADSRSKPVALVTGGTTGIGFATARLLAERGFAVVATGVNPERVAAAQRGLPSGVVVLRADLRSLSDADRVASELRDRYGKVDFAFLNAGVGRMVPLEGVDEALYDETFDVNVKGQFFTLQKILPLLTKGSSVLFNSAIGPTRGVPNWSVYSATKGAQLGLVHALAVELAPRGIRVNAIAPGPIETPALGKLGLPGEALAGLKRAMSSRVPLARIGAPEDVASVVAFLASPGAAFITGANVPVDGGLGA